MPDDPGAERPPYERPTYASLSTPPRRAPAADVQPRRSGLPWAVAAIAFAFALGLIANPWFERNVRARIPGMAVTATPDLNAERIAALQSRVAQLEATPHDAPAAAPAPAPDSTAETDAKLAQINEGIAGVAAKVDATAERADAALTSANEGAERAQTLLLIGTVRHALESGTSLATLEPGLRKAFPNQSASVDAVVAGGRVPVTLAKLRADFMRLQPAAQAPSTTWLGTIRQGLGDIVQVRRADSPVATGLAGRPLASQKLVAGDVAGALTALGPTANPAWRAEAERYLAAQRGLAALESVTVARGTTMN